MKTRFAVLALLVSALFKAGAAETVTPAGIPQNQSIYLAMRDGVKIAVDVWVPATLAKGQKVPAILKMTSYWRAVGLAGPGTGRAGDPWATWGAGNRSW